MIHIKTTEAFEIRSEKQVITYADKPKKLWLLFKILLVHYDQSLHFEQIYDYMGSDDTKDVKHLIKNLVYRLRKHLLKCELYAEDKIQIIFSNDCYKMILGTSCHLDLKILNGLKDEVIAENHHDMLFHDFHMILPEERYAEWLFPIRHVVSNTHLSLIKQALKALMIKNAYDKVIELSQFALDLYPDEELVAYFYLESLIQTGDRGKAVKYYYDLEDRLYEEYGIEPSDQLKELITLLNDTTIETKESTISLNGAMVCNLKEFQKIYQLEKRKHVRNASQAIYLNVRISSDDPVQNKSIYKISSMILEALRQSDVFAEESYGNYHILLQDINLDLIKNVEARIVNQVESLLETNLIQYEVIHVK